MGTMRKVYRGALALGLAVMATGCATRGGYWQDRAADLSDVVDLELTAGNNAHALAHLTDLFRAVLGYSTRGVPGGRSTGWVAGINFGIAGPPADEDPLPAGVRREVEAKRAREGLPPKAETKHKPAPRVSIPAFSVSPGLARGTPFREYALSAPEFSWLRVADFDLSASVLLGAHVGFSPGELVDFVLGWGGVDWGKDDG